MVDKNNPGNDNKGDQGSERGLDNVESQSAKTKMSDESFDLQRERAPEAKKSDTADKCLPDCSLDMGNEGHKGAGDNREASQVANAEGRGDRGSGDGTGGDRQREGERGDRKARHLENGRTSAEISEDGNEVSSRVGDSEVRHNRRDRSSEVRHGNDRIGMHGDCDRDELRERSRRPENHGNVQANDHGDRTVSDNDTTVETNGDDVTFRDNHRHGRHHGRGRGHGHHDHDGGNGEQPESQSQTPPETTTAAQGDQTNERGDGDGRNNGRDMGDFTLRREGDNKHGPRHLVVEGQDLGTLDAQMSNETLAKAGLTRVDDNTYRMENGRTFDIKENGKIDFNSRDCEGNENHIEMGENDSGGQPVVKQDGITISNIPGGGTKVTEPDGDFYTQKGDEFHAFNERGEEQQSFDYDTGEFKGLDLSFDMDMPFDTLGGGFSDAPLFGDAGFDGSTYCYGEEADSPEAPAEHAGEATAATTSANAACINITNASGTVSASDIAAAFGAAGNCLTVGNQLYGEYLETGSQKALQLFGDCMSMHSQTVAKTSNAQPMAVQNQVLEKFALRGLTNEVGVDVAQRFSNTNPYKIAQWLSEEVKRGGMIDSSRLANIA